MQNENCKEVVGVTATKQVYSFLDSPAELERLNLEQPNVARLKLVRVDFERMNLE